MTSPVSHGYPDFGRYRATADKVLIAQTAAVINAPQTLSRLFVGDTPYVFISLSPAVNHFHCRIDFYDAPSAGNRFSGQALSVRLNQAASWTIPVAGPWMEVILTANAYPATYTLRMDTAHVPYSGLAGEHDGNILLAANQNILAGASATVTAIRVWPGEAHWFCESAVATWTARVETLDYLGTATIIDEMRKTAAGDDGRQIFIPPISVQMVVTNQSAGAGTFRFAVVARPIEPGR